MITTTAHTVKVMSVRRSRRWSSATFVTTSGKTAADQVRVMATGPTQAINGVNYCLFFCG